MVTIFGSPGDIKAFQYELSCIVRMFLPGEKVTLATDPAEIPPNQPLVELGGQGRDCKITLHLGSYTGTLSQLSDNDDIKTRERSACRLLFRLLAEATGKKLPWGILTGVRPVKLIRQHRQAGKSSEAIRELFGSDYLVEPGKIDLCLATDQAQSPILAAAAHRDVSLYVAIPFCPTRCSYCSFVSHSVEKSRDLLPAYLARLIEELAITGEIFREKNLRLQTVYIGGGTPTVLEPAQLEALMTAIHRHFTLTPAMEFTVEAGRPDTITDDKLKALQLAGVTRVSINPQTLEPEVLAQIGRRHTVAQFYSAFEAAKAFGFTVNIDLIAGLEGDTLPGFCRSLDTAAGLGAENVTVHALTMKRAASIYSQKSLQFMAVSPTGDMVDYSQKALAQAGYHPYYLYRQKNTADSLENVGFALTGHDCAYNILIMDESQTILSVGAGGVTKVVDPTGDIQRVFNYKYPYEYLQRFDTIFARKQTIRDLLDNF